MQCCLHKGFYYLREISIKEYSENDSEDGESGAHVSENSQKPLVCLCDLVYKLVIKNEQQKRVLIS